MSEQLNVRKKNTERTKENDNKAADHGTLGRHMTMVLEAKSMGSFFCYYDVRVCLYAANMHCMLR